MKLVREHINEKFAEDGDPIHDMGIGLYIKRNFDSSEEFAEFMVNNLTYILGTKKIPADFLYGHGYYFNRTYHSKLDHYTDTYIKINNHNIENYDNKILHNMLKDKGFESKKKKLWKKEENYIQLEHRIYIKKNILMMFS